MTEEYKWANNNLMTDKEIIIVIALHKVGCKCKYPLIGNIGCTENGKWVNTGYRCRVCGKKVYNLEDK